MHQQPLDTSHKFWPTTETKKKDIYATNRVEMLIKWTNIVRLKLTLHPSRKSEAASAVPDTPAGTLEIIAWLSSIMLLVPESSAPLGKKEFQKKHLKMLSLHEH